MTDFFSGFETPENCVKDFLHKPTDTYKWINLLLFFVLYFLIAVYTYGLTISSGLFIPSLLIGASWGRLFGIAADKILVLNGWKGVDDLGKYALIGASAQLSGTVRITLTICGIILEATGISLISLACMKISQRKNYFAGNYTYAFPILAVVIISKLTADMFLKGDIF